MKHEKFDFLKEETIFAAITSEKQTLKQIAKKAKLTRDDIYGKIMKMVKAGSVVKEKELISKRTFYRLKNEQEK